MLSEFLQMGDKCPSLFYQGGTSFLIVPRGTILILSTDLYINIILTFLKFGGVFSI